MIDVNGFRRPEGRLKPFFFFFFFLLYCQQFGQSPLNYFIMTPYPFNPKTRRVSICVVY